MSEHQTTQSNNQVDSAKPAVVTKAYQLITGDEDARVCKEIPEQACQHQPRNFFGYLIANFLGKVADELASAKLILPWLMGALGAPSALVGFWCRFESLACYCHSYSWPPKFVIAQDAKGFGY
ncbi:MAG: hypothetical protein JXK16_11500 [Thiotrichales bacterium]|nr:hypothetical protein [Thiotrichales bacterium]